ncbi:MULTISPECIES: EF-P 5-aminopentanol modification-associated protein YfmH [Bacillus]|uniref:Metalloendopeptidase n=1 Tax=Bacillus licheniformis (strain ATCC 14580 / DSM 13 / JCM 2505 / CCUG 7422 / NBRC 12200 / NCIMB 9375 / NCTC 10341 / NRRL NRS-1264 / Gibson 46) TaxID=279010 RepID=Q65JF9_BACLD|nr:MULTISPECIES: pitrilysin family protein [Bacillus]AAU23445.1 putative metalloendopeptidase [Bacillus licheniformis DSM 13 = ATCC 14580]AAU40805.1 putative zinc protease YmfH [Bacillus licheniformis DSM 13 = ATCC 14580]MBG9695096.1 zinc protease [Bacillus licheniformis]MDH3167686.1 pitrilysin family protein [Bacillus licheniformis]NYV79281.1 insulinase family protein [Bacillus sp. Gen2]
MTKTIEFEQLKETLYYEKMPGGLDVYVLPKEGFNKTYAVFTTKYGSIDNQFVPLGKDEMVRVPDGIAHFLEHKLFEKEDGDVFQQFSRQGASANAFTSFTRTAYLFSSTSNVEENLETLVDFVQDPYFTEKTVEKEKGIIGQEINMYDDNPDWRLFFGLIENMYQEHPVRIDIAGTIESISHITKDLLYECYETFYHPSNMLLFVVGPADPEAIIRQVRENQQKKPYTDQPEIVRKEVKEPGAVFKKEQEIKMNVQSSKCLVGLKSAHPMNTGEALLKHELTINLILECLFGKSSSDYERIYEKGYIDETFSYDYTEEHGFGFVSVGGDTPEPDKLAEELKQVLFKAKETITAEKLELARKKKIGNFLKSMNSPEYIANQFTRYAFLETSLFDIVTVLESITLDDVHRVIEEEVEEDRITVCKVVPKS